MDGLMAQGGGRRAMSDENVRLVETIYGDDPHFAEVAKDSGADSDFVQDRCRKWYVRETGEPLSFTKDYEEWRHGRGIRLEANKR
jgi:hypothetical protein